MSALDFRQIMVAAVVFGFVSSFVFGLFLGLWASWTLGV